MGVYSPRAQSYFPEQSCQKVTFFLTLVAFGGTYSPRAQSYFPEQSCQNVTFLGSGARACKRQGPPGGPVYPSLHTQLASATLPGADVVLPGHARQ
jgi:hypothetical protein